MTRIEKQVSILSAASALGALSLLLVTGCSTKNYVRSQTTPIIQHTNELDDATAANNRNIHDVDQRATQEIQQDLTEKAFDIRLKRNYPASCFEGN